VRLADRSLPELFLSITKWPTLGAHDVNETQTYYKLGDDGVRSTSEDVHEGWSTTSASGRTRCPGNYFRAAESDGPALLTESS